MGNGSGDLGPWVGVIGDSKTLGEACCVSTQGYRSLLMGLNASLRIPYINATNGITVAGTRAGIDANLAAYPGMPLDFVLVNLGANDAQTMPTQAAFEADLGYILDAVHVKWPAARVLVMRVWRRNQVANSNTIAGWIANALSGRSAWASAGPDERVFLEGGDNGATNMSDDAHPNASGYALTAAQWYAVMGY